MQRQYYLILSLLTLLTISALSLLPTMAVQADVQSSNDYQQTAPGGNLQVPAPTPMTDVVSGEGGTTIYLPTISRTVPPTPPSSIAVAISASSFGHACALTAAGGVKCWGGNYFGQLGDGTTEDRSIPVDVVGLGTDIIAIDAGWYHTCALTTAGGVKCWGYNKYGSLGDGTTEDRRTPVDVVGLSSGVAAITSGVHTCALTTAGGVKCWGYNYSGHVGDGTTETRITPVDVIGLSSGVVAIASHWQHTCALTTAGAVKCWGHNKYGGLGDGTTEDRRTPVDVIGLGNGVAAIATGVGHTCALTTGGGVKCWGFNWFGSLGNGTWGNDNISTTPVDVIGLSSGVAAIGAGGYISCAITTAGGAKCWGGAWDGEVGNGSMDAAYTPQNVVGLGSGVGSIDPGFYFTCAVTTRGAAKCWGRNRWNNPTTGVTIGLLGNGSAESSSVPVDVVGLGGQVSPTTSSATLTKPPARGQLGLLGGLLAAGFVIGMVLVFTNEPEAMESVQNAEQQQTDDVTQG
ncbi:MAG TPA: hypothetical protein PL105_03465 [Caldilineaceae bacterium]|nr:hypothetical protein [Caldilineaceae bacterium]